MSTKTETQVKIPFIDTIKHQYFAPDSFDAATEVLESIQKNNLEPHTNCDLADFPADYELVVMPVGQRGKSNHSVAVAAIPTLTAILSAEGIDGEAWVNGILRTALTKQIANPMRELAENLKAQINLPLSVADFLESRRASAVDTKAYAALASVFVKALKSKGMKTLTNAILKQLLASKAFAESQYPKVKQSVWDHVISAMIVQAKTKSLDTAMLDNWLATRDSIEIDVVEEIDISFMNNLFDDDEVDSTEQVTAE